MIAPPSPRSDPENMDLYYNIGSASSPEYRTFRGTSQLEGYHHHLRWMFSGFSTSPQLAPIDKGGAVITPRPTLVSIENLMLITDRADDNHEWQYRPRLGACVDNQM